MPKIVRKINFLLCFIGKLHTTYTYYYILSSEHTLHFLYSIFLNNTHRKQTQDNKIKQWNNVVSRLD